jgi:hypothetical protein
MDADGIYAAFVTGLVSHGLLVLVLRDGIVTGADFAGVILDGTYTVNDDRTYATLNLIGNSPAGIMTIQGKIIPKGGEINHIEAVIPLTGDVPFFRIETPNGPVNVRLQKLRGFNK